MFKPQKARQGRHATETDPRRALGLKQSCDLLVAGGYFRAKMPTLSPFDRVIGGLVWCIMASNVDVDVDILYEENSSIGERIRVSEQVVRSLQQMKCPLPLQSFQIQGLDYDSILPILKWLIKQVIQTRALTGNESRLISIRTFDNVIGSHNIIIKDDQKDSAESSPQIEHLPIFPQDQFTRDATESTANYITLYTQQRKYKKRQGVMFDSIDQRVEATLLEYDDRHLRIAVDIEQQDMERTKKEQQGRGGKSSSSSSQHLQGDDLNDILGGKVHSGVDLSTIEGAELQRLQESNRLRALQGQLDSSDTSGGFRINAGLVGSLVNISEDAMRAQEANKAQGLIQQDKISFKDQKEIETQRHQKQCDQLQRKINDLTAQINTKKTEEDVIQNKFTQINTQHQDKLTAIATIQSKLKELDQIEASAENKELLAELKRLVMLNESIKKQEIMFKQSCKEQMGLYRQEIDILKAKIGSDGDDNEDMKKFKEVELLIEKETNRLEKVKEILYQRHLELLGVYHKIDEIPTRSELLQFEKRFIELYQIAATKLIETRSYFTWYNTLSTTYSYLQQELTLLESVLGNFSIGMKSEKAQVEMKNQMQAILAGVQENIDSTQSELSSTNDEELVLVEKYNRLMKKERDYYKLLKQFQQECDINTKLSQQVEQLPA